MLSYEPAIILLDNQSTSHALLKMSRCTADDCVSPSFARSCEGFGLGLAWSSFHFPEDFFFIIIIEWNSDLHSFFDNHPFMIQRAIIL